MKIGLLAYHSAINFGATLQLLSTYMYLKNHGHSPVIINWVAADMERDYTNATPSAQLSAHRHLRKLLWHETSLCLTEQDVAEVIKAENIEAVIIGSDAVCQHHTKRERTIFPCRKIIAIEPATSDRIFPNPFWALWNELLPHPIPVAVLSASSQDSQYKYFPKTTCAAMKKQIMSYNYVSVRDVWTQDMFVHVTHGASIPEVTPDPVFAFEQNAGTLLPSKEEIQHKYNLPEKYILLSFINEKIVSQQWIDCFQETACADGYTCVKLPFSQKESFGKMRKSMSLPLSPLEWFAIIKNSSGYVGNNMHPIVVSLHTGTPFFSFDNYGIKKFNGLLASDQSSKIKHILHSAALEDWRISCISKTFSAPNPNNIYRRLISFDYNKSKAFAGEYYKQYQDMMANIIHALTV